MKEHLYIYLAGNIKKGKEDENDQVWTTQDMEILQENLAPTVVNFLNPAVRSDDLSDQKSVFGRDLFSVFSSHLVLVDARSKRGLGVGAEMMFAKMNSIPVVTWLPEESHYQRPTIHLLGQEVNSWIHPFVFSLSDFLAPNLEQAAKWIKEVLQEGQNPIKNSQFLYETMHHYLTKQLEKDNGMYNIISNHNHFTHKINGIKKNAAQHL